MSDGRRVGIYVRKDRIRIFGRGNIRILVYEYVSPAVKAPILSEACIRVRVKYFYSFMTFGPY